MKYKFTKSFKEGDEVELVYRPNPYQGFEAVDVPDFLEAVKEPEYRYYDTGNEIKEYSPYFFVDASGDICDNFWHGFSLQKFRYEVGGIFETKEGAEKHLAFLKARATLKRFMRDKQPISHDDNGSNCYEIVWKYDQKNLFPAESRRYWEWGTIRFEKLEDAEECIRLYPEELKIVLGVI